MSENIINIEDYKKQIKIIKANNNKIKSYNNKNNKMINFIIRDILRKLDLTNDICELTGPPIRGRFKIDFKRQTLEFRQRKGVSFEPYYCIKISNIYCSDSIEKEINSLVKILKKHFISANKTEYHSYLNKRKKHSK